MPVARKKKELININSAGLATSDTWEAVRRLDATMKKASTLMGKRQARFLVDLYYQLQFIRKATGQQVSQMEQPLPDDEVGDDLSEESQEVMQRKPRKPLQFEPSIVHFWLFENMQVMENDAKRALDSFTNEYAVGRWCRSITGVGPVITAGLLANLDIRKARYASGYWRFCGCDPSIRWTKGEKRPYNAAMKRLLWVASDCWIKVKSKPSDVYGKIYMARKDYEQQKNERGEYAALAEYTLTGKCPLCARTLVPKCGVCNGFPEVEPKKWKDKDVIDLYKSGRIPAGRIHLRCMKHTGKIFLSHLHHVMHEDFYRTPPPMPFVIQNFPEHTHFIPIPNYPHNLGGKSLREMVE